MRIRFQEHAFGRLRSFVGAERNPRFREFFLNVVFGDEKINRADARFVFGNQIHRRIDRIFSPHLRDLGERLPRERF